MDYSESTATTIRRKKCGSRTIDLRTSFIRYFSRGQDFRPDHFFCLNRMHQEITFNTTGRGIIKHHIKGNDIKLLSIELNHILLLENLPQHHRDPFDRLLICQAIAENIPIISSDKDLDLYTIKRIW